MITKLPIAEGGEAGDWLHLGPCVKLRNLLLDPFILLIAPKIEPGVCPDHGCQVLTKSAQKTDGPLLLMGSAGPRG